jgi:SAM-dependent methyltransferase
MPTVTSGASGSAAHDDSGFRAQPLDVAERAAIAREWLLPWVEAHKGGPGSLRGAFVVEFGCGPGAYTLPLAELGCRVVGVDIDESEVAVARRRVSEAGARHVELHGGPFEALVEIVRSSAGDGADLFLLAATLEHMTIHERLTVLRLARELLRPDGLLVIWETPNRLLWSDYHTSGDPFFHQLPDELALGWVDRVPREELRGAVRSGGALQLWRWGRGASFHEFELAFGDLTGRIVAGGFDPATIDLRTVDRDELALAKYLERKLPRVHPAFSRYWLDLIVRNEPTRQPAPVWRPWTFDTNDSWAVGYSVWGLLHFHRADSWLGVRPGGPVGSLLLGAEPTEKLQVSVWNGDACIGQVDFEASDRTVYEVVDLLAPASELVIHVDAPGVLSFIATKAV